MVKKTQQVADSQKIEENKERVNKIASEILDPALRAAIVEAEKVAPPIEVISALSNVYGSLLVDLFGKKTACSILKDYYEHLAATEETVVTTGDN